MFRFGLVLSLFYTYPSVLFGYHWDNRKKQGSHKANLNNINKLCEFARNCDVANTIQCTTSPCASYDILYVWVTLYFGGTTWPLHDASVSLKYLFKILLIKNRVCQIVKMSCHQHCMGLLCIFQGHKGKWTDSVHHETYFLLPYFCLKMFSSVL